VKWQQHFFTEPAPKPQSKNISPEQRPQQQKFEENLGYETLSEQSPEKVESSFIPVKSD
jgi:hypothetical protein